MSTKITIYIERPEKKALGFSIVLPDGMQDVFDDPVKKTRINSIVNMKGESVGAIEDQRLVGIRIEAMQHIMERISRALVHIINRADDGPLVVQSANKG